MSNWSMVTYRDERGAEHAGIQRADGVVVTPAELVRYDGLFAALQDWGQLATALRDVRPQELPPVTGARLIQSVRYPRKLICAGANYVDHIAEMGDSTIPAGWRPFFFLIPPTTALAADGEAIEISPDDDGAKVDWEAELAIVIGRRATRVSLDAALDYVAGYACVNDVTARGALRRDVALGPPFQWDWAGAKALDTFTPMGAVTPAWLIADPDDLRVRCWVNDQLKQDGTTRDLICDVRELIAAASELCTLEPGDVIATGTPAGVGIARGEQLRDGDEVRVAIDGLAPLTNPVRARAGTAPSEPAASALAG